MCVIYGVRVNLVSPPTGPQELRITGQASSCGTGQVLITSSITNASGPVQVNAQGRFRASLPVTQTAQCGDTISVRVECDQDTSCFWQDTSLQVPCCEVQIVSIQGQVPLGALTPTAINVSGTLLGCYNDQVVVRVSLGPTTILGPSPASPVDPYTGTFNISLAIPANVTVHCDDKVRADAWCASSTACSTKKEGVLDCPGCARASISYTAGACSGNPLLQPVTLHATINIPAGQSITFQWDYGDGTFGAPFTVNNATGSASTAYSHDEPAPPLPGHNYPPGSYTARLLIIGPPWECDVFTLPITVQCSQCPTVTGSATVGPCYTVDAANPSPNDYHRLVTFTLNFSPAIAQNTSAYVTWNYGGATSTGATSFNQTVATSTGPVALLTHQVYLKHKAGGYSATATVMIVSQGQLCTPTNIQFAVPTGTNPPAVNVDACLPCPDRIDVTRISPAILPCAPTTNKLEFQASVVWPAGITAPPNPAGYDWDISLPAQSGQAARQAKVTNGPASVDTSSGWSGTGATAAGAVDLSNAGTYSIGVTAKYALSSGLPTDENGISECNLTGSHTFSLSACCPHFIGQLTVTQGNSACEWLFSVQVDNPNEVQKYDWSLDGQPIPGTAANNSFTFSPGAITTHTISVTMTPKSPGCPTQSQSSTFSINCFAAPPKVTGCSVTAGANGAGSVRVMFDTDVDPNTATDPANYSISINGGAGQNPAAGSLSYNSATKTTTISGLSINAGDSVSITVTGVKDATGSVTIGSQNTTNCAAPKGGGGGGGGEFNFCAGLLITAVALLVIGAILVILGVCTGVAYLWIAGAIVGGVGLVLFILWAIFCSMTTPCSVMQAVHCFLFWLIAVVAPIIVALAAIFGGLPCAIASAAAWGGWGTLYAWLGFIMGKVGCAKTC